VRSSNPVLSRLGQAATTQRPADGYGIYPAGAGPVVQADRMTLDDVVVRTVALLALTGLAGAVSWLLLPDGPAAWLAVIGSSLAGLVLVLVISFARVTNPLVIAAYAVVEGVALGVVSRLFEHVHSGIVIQAVVGTFGVFFGMALLYRAKILRATPRFTRFVIGALIGVVVLSLANWLVYLFGGNLHLIEYDVTGPRRFLPILFSLVCIGVGALTFILDFEMVAQGVRQGLPERFAWYCAFGLLVGLIFLYWQILRLLGYLYGGRR
jgi:uncharacterized YccA/Bax inhibitor family protein